MTLSAHEVSQTGAAPKLELLQMMQTSREVDRREGILIRQSKGYFHIAGMGHEALAALAYHLREDDYLFPHYRDRALMLARGISVYDMAMMFFAKAGSSSGGRAMPGHYSDRKLNVFSMPSPVAANQLPAAGTAWGMKLTGTDSVVLSSIGDASTREGEFYEAVAFAVEKKLPLVLLVSDNHYGISTPTAEKNPFRIGVFGKNFVQPVDGRDVDALFEAGREAVEKARAGEGPTVLWLDLDRLSSHSSSDDMRVYREQAEIEAMFARDPIKLLSEKLIASGEMTAGEWSEMQERIQHFVDEEYKRAGTSPDPEPAHMMDQLYGEPEPPLTPPLEGGQRTTMVKAVNQTILEGLKSDEHVVAFGQDIEDPKGGVFGFTKGCSDACPDRVFNSPLAEATIAGVAVGLAAYGLRPIFEMQFTDFIPPAFNQLITNVATLRWRSAGNWACPMVLYAPYGAYLPGGGMWHSQSNDGLFAKLHGIRVGIPSTPEDAAGLFWSAAHGEDPSLILIPKHIFRKQLDVPAKVEPVPFGKARTVRAGDDVTVVTWGNCVEMCIEAAEKLELEASLEVIDLRSLVPCDWAAIEASLKKTGRLVVVHEDSKTCGFGGAIVAEMTGKPERWNLFLSPPQVVGREDVHIGYNPVLEYAALPDLDDVMKAVRLVME